MGKFDYEYVHRAEKTGRSRGGTSDVLAWRCHGIGLKAAMLKRRTLYWRVMAWIKRRL